MNYFHKFNSTDAFELSKYGDGTYQEPWVSWNEEDDSVSFNKTYRELPFTIKALDDDTDVEILNDAPDGDPWEFEYSTDNGQTWISQEIDVGSRFTYNLMLNGVISIRSNYSSLYSEDGSSNVDRFINIGATSGEIEIYGNIMSLVDASTFYARTSFDTDSTKNFYHLFDGNTYLVDASNLVLPATTLSPNCYGYMFNNCTSLIAIPKLPAITLAEFCYESMFHDCTSLSTISEGLLPATTLASNCYDYMFFGCTALTTAPALPATTLASYCYRYMFEDCTNLTTAPTLPAATLARGCYVGMFMGCINLVNAPTLPATILINQCYDGMFSRCTSLVNAPALPATTLANSCYSDMFLGCTSLTSVPELPATSLVNYCYSSMFQGCTSLTSVPTNYLHATTLANYCYQSMFKGCTHLTSAPDLPATTVTPRCYENMFNNCKALTTAPTLPALTLVSDCYHQMFYGCSNLNYIKALFTTAPTNTYTSMWVTGVSSTGTFVKNSAATWNVTGSSAVPSGWTVLTTNV